MDNIAIVFAHPDDVAACMGGTALMLKDKYKIHLFCGTRGERGVPEWDMAKAAEVRTKEEMAEAKMLDAELTFLDRIDGELFADREICESVAATLKKLKPVAVFTLWPIDSHPDHAAASDIAKKACYLAGLDCEFYFMEAGLGSQVSQFHPDIYVDITSVVERKTALIRCHACQNVDDRLATGMLNHNNFRGRESGIDMKKQAEGFKTIFPASNNTKSILMN